MMHTYGQPIEAYKMAAPLNAVAGGKTMAQASELHKLALKWIVRLPAKKKFAPVEIYRHLAGEHAEKVRAHKAKANESRHTYDARWAIQTAKHTGFIVHVRHGLWERTIKGDENAIRAIVVGWDDL
jgi:hypothetical protein